MTSSIPVEDRLAILDLFARYAWAYDSGDRDAYAALFCEDGVLADQNGILGAGREGVKEALQAFLDMRGNAVWRHFNDHHLFSGGGDRASVRSYWLVAITNRDGSPNMMVTGTYDTELRRVDGAWLIQRRTFFIDQPD